MATSPSRHNASAQQINQERLASIKGTCNSLGQRSLATSLDMPTLPMKRWN
ncbi:MAG: hypothetical protein R2788_22945 [Saprospiraceae bacterium]